jgi:hypothetical protein
MDIFTEIGMAAVALLAVYWLSRRPVLGRLTQAEREIFQRGKLIEELTAALRTSNESRVEFERQVQKAVADELEAARFAAKDWERRATEYRDSNAGIIGERDAWNRLYDEQSIGHGNAQAMMMDAIQHLQRKLRDAGVTVALPPIIRETQELYRERHVEPALARTGGTTVARGPSQGQTMSDQDQK